MLDPKELPKPLSGAKHKSYEQHRTKIVFLFLLLFVAIIYSCYYLLCVVLKTDLLLLRVLLLFVVQFRTSGDHPPRTPLVDPKLVVVVLSEALSW